MQIDLLKMIRYYLFLGLTKKVRVYRISLIDRTLWNVGKMRVLEKCERLY